MERSIKLRNVCACRIPAALEALLKDAISHLEPHRPPSPMLELLKLERHHVPLVVDLTGCLADYGLYSELPSPYNRLGNRVLGAAVKMCAACPKVGCPGAADCGERCGHCRHCGRVYGSELTLYLTVCHGFPFTPEEVACFFYRYFDMRELAAATVTRGYHHLLHITDEVNALAAGTQVAAPGAAQEAAPGAALDVSRDVFPDASPDVSMGAAGAPAEPLTPQPAVRRKSGAPQLHCNVWLYNQLRVLPDPRQCSHLKPHWRELYLEEVGMKPEDWDKSFRAAARYCRMLIARGQGGLGA